MAKNWKDTPYGALHIIPSLADGNCFFHSFLQSIEPTTYSRLSDKQKRARVMEIRASIVSKLKPIDVYELIDPVSFDKIKFYFDKWLIDKGLKPIDYHHNDFSIRGYINELHKHYSKLSTNPLFVKHTQELLLQFGSDIKRYLAEDGSWMMDRFIPLFSKITKVDIVFISHETNQPIQLAVQGGYEHVIMMFHSGNHFESMALETPKGLVRVFTPESSKRLV